MIGDYALPNVDRSLVGSVLLEENSSNRDALFETMETVLEELTPDWLDEIGADFQIG